LGVFAERCRGQKQRGENGAAVKILRAKRGKNFGYRKGRRSRGCRVFESPHSDHRAGPGANSRYELFCFVQKFVPALCCGV